ncbi:hypothetical protein [Arthrobacter sp. H20]|uniref:hypothetical protein n=1 Tax=Arthrobacter sp. H20 TaxID=1267981 RepID=UPI0004BC6D30|nr:hypothetical protein [Arthrobacter sp. H20]
MHSFNATARQEGTWWIIDIPELGQTTQARNAAAIQDTATDLAAVILDVDPSEVNVTVSMQTPSQ